MGCNEPGDRAVAGRIWDGSDVAQEMLKRVRDEVVAFQREGHAPPCLVEIWVQDPPFGERLKGLQEDACRLAGVSHQVRAFSPATDQDTIVRALADLNADPSVTGIAVHAPSRAYRGVLASAVAPDKDVDGSHPLNLGRFITRKCPRPATRGIEILQLLRRAGLELAGSHVVCIGDDSGLGSALALLCLHENATVTAWRGATIWPSRVLNRAEILVIDTDDSPGSDSSPLKPGVVIVDVRGRAAGWAQLPQKSWLDAVSLLIPVPSGVGPMTVAMRLSSLVALYRTQIRAQPDP